ncbi:hypothetical protein JCM11641_001928 [Rhodosporidiobolus odoratus]
MAQSGPSRSRASSLSRPTTPLRRLSSSSLRTASLSHSLSRSQSGAAGAEPPLAHLAPVFAELADAVSDLTANFERLTEMSNNLGEINESFAAFLLGLRANGYTVDFLEAPTKLNFDLAQERAKSRFLAEQAARLQHQQQEQDHLPRSASPPRSPLGNETTFVTNDDESFMSSAEDPPLRSGSAAGRGRGRGGLPVRGGRGGRGGKAAPVGRKRKEEMAAFADPIVPLLPISLRENRRPECERVLWALKEKPAGLAMADLVAALASPSAPAQTIPQVRINEALLALVRAKVVIKSLVKGSAQYRLDPSRVST